MGVGWSSAAAGGLGTREAVDWVGKGVQEEGGGRGGGGGGEEGGVVRGRGENEEGGVFDGAEWGEEVVRGREGDVAALDLEIASAERQTHVTACEASIQAANALLDLGDAKGAVTSRMLAMSSLLAARTSEWMVDKLHTVSVRLEERDESAQREALHHLDARIQRVTSHHLLTSGEEAIAAARGCLEQDDLEMADIDQARRHVATAMYAFTQAAGAEGAEVGEQQVLSLQRHVLCKALLLRAQAAMGARIVNAAEVMQMVQEGLGLLEQAKGSALPMRSSLSVREKEMEGELRVLLSRMLGKQGRWEDALEEAKRSYALRPLSHESFQVLAAAHAALQCPELAAAELELAETLERLKKDKGNDLERARLREALAAYTVDRDLLEIRAYIDKPRTDDEKPFEQLEQERENRRRRDSRNHSPTRLEMRQRVVRPSPADMKHEQDRVRSSCIKPIPPLSLFPKP